MVGRPYFQLQENNYHLFFPVTVNYAHNCSWSTSSLCKTLETLIRDKVVKFLEENSLINNSQFGVRNKRSCLTKLLDFFSYVYNVYDDCRSVDIICLDFQSVRQDTSHTAAHKTKGSWRDW